MCESLVAPTGEDVGEDVEVNVGGGGDEAEHIKLAVDPGAPTAVQIEAHRLSHIPSSSWCKWCVLGRGRGIQHRKAGASEIPIVGLDYLLLAKGGVHIRSELEVGATPEGEERLEAARKSGEVVK